MKQSIWQRAIKSCAEPGRAKNVFELLSATAASGELESASAEQVRILCALFSGARALSEWLVAHPEAIEGLRPDTLQFPRRRQGLHKEVNAWLGGCLETANYSGALAKLRLFKQREQMRIAARDLARLADVTIIIEELSDLADVCLASVERICERQFRERFGGPYHQDADGNWRETAFCVLGMGKLGGRELNYSSDVDVIFVYDEEGRVLKKPPGKAKHVPEGGLSNHQYFNRLAEAFIAEVGRMTGEGMLYRIDLRLRPEGDAGPLARSLPSYENYYAQWGQTWERMMLIKARGVAGEEALAAEFLETIQSFRYPRSLGERVLREISAMKERIEREVVKAGELDRNVKLGRGGIREIEFVVQTMQLLHAGRMPFLQGAQTLPALEKLVEYERLREKESQVLSEAYCFLRDVEHRLQMEDNLQTHTIPVSPESRERLAALMGFASLAGFEKALAKHTTNVREVYDRMLRSEEPAAKSEFPREFAGMENQWKEILARHGFKHPGQAVRLLNEFVDGPGYVHVSPRTVDLAWQLVPRLFRLCPKQDAQKNHPDGELPVLSDPDRVLTRLDAFITAYGTRAMLFETWNSNPSIFELLILLFDRSEFLAEIAIRTPDLVDSLVTSDRLRQRKTAGETLADLRFGLDDADQHLWLRRYHQAELMRIGLRDILGLADFEQNLVELSALADACLQYALEVVLRKHKFRKPPLVIVGLGKLGGEELNYGSDLDVMFVTGASARQLPKLQRLAVEVMDLLSARTELGSIFATDARLRPDGEKGLLVNSLEAYEDYYRHRAQLWEIQAISRTRPIAGDMELGRRFQILAAALTDFRAGNVADGFATKTAKGGRRSGLSAYDENWRSRIRHMRERIEKERTPAGKNALAIKTGTGGLMDAEFIAQAFSLANGWHEANTLRALARGRDENVIGKKDSDRLIENYRKLRRVEGILRRWSYEGETVLPDDPAPFLRVSIRCGHASPEAFAAALSEIRGEIRAVYEKVFAAGALDYKKGK